MKLRSQDGVYKDYPIQFLSAIGLKVDEMDDYEMLLDSLLSIKQIKGNYFYYNPLFPIFETESSSVYPAFETKSETSLIEEIIEEKSINLQRISKIVDKLIKESEAFKTIDKTKLIEIFSNMINILPSEQLISIADDELTRRIKKIMTIEVLTGVLDDLDPEQIEAFNTAVKRREFFK